MSIVKLNNRGIRSATAVGTTTQLGDMVFISKSTASGSATIDFTSGIDSTYKEYIFTFKDIHPATDAAEFQFQADTGTNTNYNQTITSTQFQLFHNEADNDTASMSFYATSNDQAQGTAFQDIFLNSGNGNDECIAGTLHLFDPSNTTFVKHFISTVQGYHNADASFKYYTAGYFNTTTALTRVRFKYSSGNIDAGDICLYGIN